MSIELFEVSNKKQLKQFIQFPLDLYKDNAYFVPTLIKDELDFFDQEKNPVFKHADAWYYLAYKDGKIVGRIAAIINRKEVTDLGQPKMRFGWLDMIDDLEVTKALLKKVYRHAQDNKLKRVEGPIGFSNLEKAGMLTEGFEEISTMITYYNHAYYPEHLKELGFEKANEWVEYKFTLNDLPEKVIKFQDLIKRRYKLKVLNVTKRKDLLPYIDQVFDLIRSTYKGLSTYVPISDEQVEYFKDKFVPIIDMDLLTLIEDEDNQLVAFAMAMPSLSRALQKSKGKMFPFGWYHLYKAMKKNDRGAFYLIGVVPRLQGKGVTATLFYEMDKGFKGKGISKLETNPELADNKEIQALWSDYDATLHKRRCSFYKMMD